MAKVWLVFAVHYWGGVWYNTADAVLMSRAECAQFMHHYPEASCRKHKP